MNQRPARRSLQIAACAACALALANCNDQGQDHPDHLAIADVSGKSIADVSDHVPSEATFLVQQPSMGSEDAPLYDSSQQESTRWIVLAGCSEQKDVDDSDTVEVSVIPQDDYDKSIKSQVASGELADTVTCDGREYHSNPV
jgi:ABC-type glycerol-3-phosphate transport system substrate-binding protein